VSTRKISPLNAAIQKLASTYWGARIFSRLLHHLDRGALRLTGNRRTLSSTLSGLEVGILTTTGARSGLLRSLPLLLIRLAEAPDAVGLVASSWGQKHIPGWYYNLKANPCASLSIGGKELPYRAREAEGEEYQRYWQAAEDTYIGFPAYKRRAAHRRIPIMVLEKER
jgi:deazaflavin-dependent oxidoreductase (nitroreductase family)